MAMTGVERIAIERTRQVEKEGYDAAHDDEHGSGDLAVAAACYAAASCGLRIYEKQEFAAGMSFVDPWPWEGYDARPYDHHGGGFKDPDDDQALRLLEKAGALIAAEIDRVLRARERKIERIRGRRRSRSRA
jgi:hypothetical protein